GGADLNNTECGTNSQVEDGNTIVQKFNGNDTNLPASYLISVPLGAVALRVELNSRDYSIGQCVNSPNNGQPCVKQTDCPRVCINGNDGTPCTDNTPCGFGTCDGPGAVCVNSTNDGTPCTNISACTGSGPSCSGRACANGTNDGTPCVDNTACTGGGT